LLPSTGPRSGRSPARRAPSMPAPTRCRSHLIAEVMPLNTLTARCARLGSDSTFQAVGHHAAEAPPPMSGSSRAGYRQGPSPAARPRQGGHHRAAPLPLVPTSPSADVVEVLLPGPGLDRITSPGRRSARGPPGAALPSR
jgi:hypothetical protein